MKHVSTPRFVQRLKPLAVPFLQLALPFLLSASQLRGGYAPFALALVTVSGARLPGLLSLAGVGGGALVFLDFQTGLRQFAVAVLIYAANTFFYDTRFCRRPLFLPILSAGLMLLVQSMYLLQRSAEQWMACFAAMAILTLAARCWRELWQRVDKLSAALLAMALAAAIQPVALLGGISLGRIVAVGLLLWWTIDASPAEGAAFGAALGLLLDLSPAGSGLLLTAVYGCGGAVSALCRRWPRPLMAAACSLTVASAAVLFRADMPVAALYESLLAAPAFVLLFRAARPARLASPSGQAPAPDAPYLKQSAAALRELYDSFFRGTVPVAQENPAVLFDRAAEQVCRDCVLCSTCWQREYNSTYNAFNDACPKLLRRGQAAAQDFPSYFASRCVRFSRFLTAVNGELRAYLTRQQYHRRLLDMRQQAQEQYRQLGEALASSAAVHAISNVSAPIGYQVGTAMRPKAGESLCGDHLAVFEVGPTLYLLLSDGMGSGEAAHREAAMTVRLLQQFLKAGIEPAPALKTLNSALRLRGEEAGGFTTIDLLALQRGTGSAAVYKYGAAPSYIKRTGTVSRITGQSLPAGLQTDPPEFTRLTLLADSYFVMISDGVADETDDEWLQDLLAGWHGNDVDALVALILRESRSRKGNSDDRAVLILHLGGGENAAKKV